MNRSEGQSQSKVVTPLKSTRGKGRMRQRRGASERPRSLLTDCDWPDDKMRLISLAIEGFSATQSTLRGIGWIGIAKVTFRWRAG